MEHNEQLVSTLENLNNTLLDLKEKLSLENTQNVSPQTSTNLKPFSSQAQQEADIIAQSFQHAFQQAENSLFSFSQKSKLQFSDLSSFIQKAFSDIPIGDIFSQFFPFKAHSGALINDLSKGLQSDEIPVIARKGEAIFTPQQMNAADQILSQSLQKENNVSVNIHNNTPAQIETSKSTDTNGHLNLDIIISEAEGLMARRLSLGTGIAPVIEGRYGISPLGRG